MEKKVSSIRSRRDEVDGVLFLCGLILSFQLELPGLIKMELVCLTDKSEL